MLDLWADSSNSSVESDSKSNMALAQVKPQDLVIEDFKYQRALETDTQELAQTMWFSEQLTKAVFQISDYVPNTQDGRNSMFWKEKVSRR
jgi:glycosylphosphatidylinositol transamidase (GPIT) subunit GPI8